MKIFTLVLVTTVAIACPAISRERLGVGATFFYVGLTFEVFAELPVWDVAAFRLGGGMFSGGEYTGFLANCGSIVAFGDAFRPYLGIEGVAGMFIRPQHAWIVGWDWLAGFFLRFSENLGIYAQVRFLKGLATEGLEISLPGVGFPLVGVGILGHF